MELKTFLEFAGAIVAVAALCFGLYQYYIAQKWKRAEFAAHQLQMLSSDAELDLCCKLLEWAGHASPVPEKYRVLSTQATFEHDLSTLLEAMLPREDADRSSWDWKHMVYREVFDRFFSYLERINHYISIDLISVSDVASLRYWLEQIARPCSLPQEHRTLFVCFMDRYRYSGVRELMGRFRISMDDKEPGSTAGS